MTMLYDIYFSGELVEGFDRNTVARNLGQLFKADENTVAKLLGGQTQRLKRGLDKAGALKYKKALAAAGAQIAIRPTDAARQTPEASTAANETATTSSATTAPLVDAPSGEPAAPQIATQTGLNEMSLAPAGSDVLRENERKAVATAEVDTSAIQLESPFLEPKPVARQEPPPPPDTSHLTTAEVGEDIPHLADERVTVDPDVSHIDLVPEGADFREVVPKRDDAAVVPDTDSIELAPEGSDVLPDEFRQTKTAPPPDTSHIQLDPSPT